MRCVTVGIEYPRQESVPLAPEFGCMFPQHSLESAVKAFYRSVGGMQHRSIIRLVPRSDNKHWTKHTDTGASMVQVGGGPGQTCKEADGGRSQV